MGKAPDKYRWDLTDLFQDKEEFYTVYLDWLKKITGRSILRRIEMKEVIMDDVVPSEAVDRLSHLKQSCIGFLSRYPKMQSYYAYWMSGYDKGALSLLSAELESCVEYLGNSDRQLVINKLMDYPVLRSLFFYYPVNNRILSFVIMAVFPIGIAGYLIGTHQQKALKKDIRTIMSVSDEIMNMYEEKSE